jgi:hypothetical protein
MAATGADKQKLSSKAFSAVNLLRTQTFADP